VPRLTRPDPGTPAAAGDGQHRKQLDGLRALAVGAVLITHLTWLWPQGGGCGVALFFVLSGYLITGILLRGKVLVESGQTVALTLRQFYARRCLRILPIVYLVLGVGWLLGDAEIRRLIWWHLCYLSNFVFAVHGFPQETAHFWSLAVEEQFYLVWPLFILLCPRRAIVGVLAGLILLSAVFRVVIPDWFSGRFPEVLTPSVIDALCFGALVTVAQTSRRVAALIAWLGPIAALVAMPELFNLLPSQPNVAALSVIYCCRGLAFAWLVGLAARGNVRLLERLLGGSLLVYIGRISYGIYVYHPFVTAFYDNCAATPAGAVLHFLPRYGFITLASVALAAISWHFFEAPINALKRYLPYSVMPKPNILLLPASH
jgi:peptidoglycan/LPS O-acetylase OafA/YrhL